MLLRKYADYEKISLFNVEYLKIIMMNNIKISRKSAEDKAKNDYHDYIISNVDSVSDNFLPTFDDF